MKITEIAQQDLSRQAETYRLNSVAASTKKTRANQWGIYEETCARFGWDPLPCNVEQACLYVTYLAQRLKPSSVRAYYQAVIFYHVCAGVLPVRMSDPVLKATLQGIERAFPGDTKGKDPILPPHLLRIMRVAELGSELEFIVCVAALFMFRTLLRVSNIVVSNHTLKARDVTFSKEGCFVRVSSSKTTSSRDTVKVLPIVFSRDKRICAATWLKMLFLRFKPAPDAQLFSSPNVPVLGYTKFSKKFKELTVRAGLVGDFASHSLRRGGATFMSMLERPLDQIKSRGQWKSDCVFRYIVPPMSSMLENEKAVAKHC